MNPIEYLESLVESESSGFLGGKISRNMICDHSARHAIDSVRYGGLTEDEAILNFMRYQKERADALQEQVIKNHMERVSPGPIVIDGVEYFFKVNEESKGR